MEYWSKGVMIGDLACYTAGSLEIGFRLSPQYSITPILHHSAAAGLFLRCASDGGMLETPRRALLYGRQPLST